MGGAIYFKNINYINIINSKFDNNKAMEQGGALDIEQVYEIKI